MNYVLYPSIAHQITPKFGAESKNLIQNYLQTGEGYRRLS